MDELQYELLEANNAETLQRKVNDRIDKGWKPLGGASVAVAEGWDYPFIFTQAMTSTSESRKAAALAMGC
jgi:phage protein D